MFNQIKPLLYFLLIGLVVIIGSFPENTWVYSTGIDHSIRWVFNYLFSGDSSLGSSIVFPHGPLGIIIYPFSGNIDFAYILQSAIKLCFIYNVFKAIESENQDKKWAITLIVSYLYVLILGFTHLCLLTILLSLYNGIRLEKKAFLVLGSFLLAISLYVSAYQGVIALIILFSSFVYQAFFKKLRSNILFQLSSLLVGIIIINLYLYGNLSALINYLIGLSNLIQDSSSAVAYYPQNNWWLLSLFFLSIILLFIRNMKEKSALLFMIIGALAIFAAWKHGMSREDTTHARGFLEFTIATLGLFVISQKKGKLVNTVLTILAFFMLSANLVNVQYYGPTSYDLMKIENFLDFFQNRKELEKKSIEESNKNVSVNKLPESISKVIGQQKVDIYPWDYTIIDENKLNWQPRVIIQSYASYTSWLDQQNANHFASDNSPEFIIWMVEKYHPSINRGEYNSIDNRHLLNDEPKTIKVLLENYKLIKNTENFYLYQKRKKPLVIETADSEIANAKLNEWVLVEDKASDELLRLKIDFPRTFLQRLKSFFYKDEQYWIFMKTENNVVHPYRIVPNNAKDGLWINPYLLKRGELLKIKSFKIIASNQSILDSSFSYTWEHNSCAELNLIPKFFGAEIGSSKKQLVNSFNDFESRKNQYYPTLSYASLETDSTSRNTVNQIKPSGFSASFITTISDSLDGNIMVHSNLEIYWKDDYKPGKVIMVVEFREGDKLLKYERVFVDRQIVNTSGLNTILINSELYYKGNNLTLKTYLWNTSEETIKLDNHGVLIFEK